MLSSAQGQAGGGQKGGGGNVAGNPAAPAAKQSGRT